MRELLEFEMIIAHHDDNRVLFDIRKTYESGIVSVSVYRNSHDFMRTIRAALHKAYGILGQVSVEFSTATDVYRVATIRRTA